VFGDENVKVGVYGQLADFSTVHTIPRFGAPTGNKMHMSHTALHTTTTSTSEHSWQCSLQQPARGLALAKLLQYWHTCSYMSLRAGSSCRCSST
jgi:hypothetical protein